MTNPEGRFDTNNIDLIQGFHWVFPDDPFRALPPEVFLRDYYEPRLLLKILSGEDLRPVRPLAELNRVQPGVQITAVKKGQTPDLALVTVKVSRAEGVYGEGGKTPFPVVAASLGGLFCSSFGQGPLIAASALYPGRTGTLMRTGVYDLRLFREGQLVAQWPEPGQQPEPEVDALSPQSLEAWRQAMENKLRADGTQTRTFPVRLPHREQPGPVEFTAYAFNEDRVKSETAQYTYQALANPPKERPRAYLICMGVNASQSPAWDLRFAAADARLMNQTVGQALQDTGRHDLVPILLTSERDPDGNLASALATKGNLQAALALLAGGEVDPAVKRQLPGADKIRQATPDDLVLVFFSGHGYTDQRGALYLIPYDVGTSQAQVRAVLPRCLSSGELSEWLRKVDAGEVFLIVDACHSAAAVQEPGFKPGPLGSRGLGQLAYDKGMRVLAASQADDVALESNQIRQGLLTYALVHDGLKERRAAQDGKTTLGGLLAFAAERVPFLYDEVVAGNVRDARDEQARQVEPVRPKDPSRSSVQRPELFDYARKRPEIVLIRRKKVK